MQDFEAGNSCIFASSQPDTRKFAKMVRKLKYHEKKLLRKTDFITYKQDNGHRDKEVIRRYNIQKPENYAKYNRICGVCAAYERRVVSASSVFKKE